MIPLKCSVEPWEGRGVKKENQVHRYRDQTGLPEAVWGEGKMGQGGQKVQACSYKTVSHEDEMRSLWL